MKKSNYSLWNMNINGEPRWGVNGLRWGTHLYTVGAHNGYDTRKTAVAKLKALRSEERDAINERNFINSQTPLPVA